LNSNDVLSTMPCFIMYLAFAAILNWLLGSAFALPPRTAVDYGDCKSRLILYLKVADGFKGWGFKPTNQKDFQHRASPYFVPIAVFICNRLQNECMGPTETFNACNSALTFASAGKVGEKADRFNKDIIPDVAPKPEPTPTPPAPEPSKAWRNQYKIKAKLFGLQHEYDGDVNLKSWFDSSRSASLHACPNSSDVSE
jgi:hypothetical protein